jgi:hypothetical protein
VENNAWGLGYGMNVNNSGSPEYRSDTEKMNNSIEVNYLHVFITLDLFFPEILPEPDI